MAKEEPEKAMKLADEIIRNTYRTLLTRGQKGCFVYCTDKELEQYLRNRLRDIQIEYEANEFFRGDSIVAEDSKCYE